MGNLNENFLTPRGVLRSRMFLYKIGIYHNKGLFCRNVIMFSERFLSDWLALKGSIMNLLCCTATFCVTYLLTCKPVELHHHRRAKMQ